MIIKWHRKFSTLEIVSKITPVRLAIKKNTRKFRETFSWVSLCPRIYKTGQITYVYQKFGQQKPRGNKLQIKTTRHTGNYSQPCTLPNPKTNNKKLTKSKVKITIRDNSKQSQCDKVADHTENPRPSKAEILGVKKENNPGQSEKTKRVNTDREREGSPSR